LAQNPDTLAVLPSEQLALPPAPDSIDSVDWPVPTLALAASRTGRPDTVRITSTSLPGVRPLPTPAIDETGTTLMLLEETFVSQFVASVSSVRAR
jgi:hypothetical protein